MSRTNLVRFGAVVVAFLLMGATLGSAGAAEDSDIGVLEAVDFPATGVATAPDTSGSGWELRREDGTLADVFETSEGRLALRVKDPILSGSYAAWILDPAGNGTSICPLTAPCVASYTYYSSETGLKSATDHYWYINGNARELGTYRVVVCTNQFCTTVLVDTTFDLVNPTASFRSVGAEDGWVLEKSESANVGGQQNSGATTLRVGDNYKDRQYRSILSFDTSNLPNNAVVTKVTLRVKQKSVTGKNPFTTHRPLYVDIRKGFFGSGTQLQISDFEATASRNRVGSFGNTSSGGWYTAVLSSTAHGRINLKGTTQFRLGFKLDDNDDHGNDFVSFYSGNIGVNAARPELTVEYYVP